MRKMKIFLNVRCLWRWSVAVKPRFKVRPVNTTVVEGHSVMLHCVATGDPTPTIQWDRNNKVDAFDLHRFKVRQLHLH